MNKRVVVLGAGYGGLVAALKLAKETPAGSVDITLVNKYDYHQLVTQLYEPAAAAKRDTEVRFLSKVARREADSLCRGCGDKD